MAVSLPGILALPGASAVLAWASARLSVGPTRTAGVTPCPRRRSAGVAGPGSDEVLQISEANQRILLHRGRARVRQGIETLLADDTSPARTPDQPAGGARLDS